ncbi:uncharacterized protein BX663DRAFT_514092 [Cokeromyces recurvatus]|uniref:uncharacterized protein n=1 Tax=Cokeromyces recurvatus TaxID=90255 RepID=UPI002220E26D|nr:uncharacterized protein BX663DRAFT_514092 [Cokeromyces recurvatus]KAI7901318.1 hypothetical protein BX663DRAFT_514092 [Cokeromyces recurvatus]
MNSIKPSLPPPHTLESYSLFTDCSFMGMILYLNHKIYRATRDPNSTMHRYMNLYLTSLFILYLFVAYKR